MFLKFRRNIIHRKICFQFTIEWYQYNPKLTHGLREDILLFGINFNFSYNIWYYKRLENTRLKYSNYTEKFEINMILLIKIYCVYEMAYLNQTHVHV